MHGLDLLLYTAVSALACWQILEIWRHGSIFDRPRAWLEVHEGFFVDLLLCMFCLSNWVGPLCVAGVFVVAFGPDNFEWHYLIALPFLGLAVARLANLFNDLSRGFSRTPNRGDEGVEELQNIAGGVDATEPRGDEPAAQL